MTTLLTLARQRPFLSLLMSALLAWPAYLPTISKETTQPGPSRILEGIRPHGATLHRADRKSSLGQADWTDVADKAEDSDDRDDFRFMTLVVAHQPLDLPSLVPSSLDTPPIGPVDPSASFLDFSPLRC